MGLLSRRVKMKTAFIYTHEIFAALRTCIISHMVGEARKTLLHRMIDDWCFFVLQTHETLPLIRFCTIYSIGNLGVYMNYFVLLV